MTERYDTSAMDFFEPGRRLPSVVYGYNTRLLQAERLREAATVVNQDEGRNLFEIESIAPDERTLSRGPDYVRIRIVGEWITDQYSDASKLWRAKEAIDASSASK